MENDPISTIAHKLRTPLTVIMSTVNNLLDGAFGSLNDAQHKWLKKLETHTQNLERLLNTILDILKKESNKSEIVRDAIDRQDKAAVRQTTPPSEQASGEETLQSREMPTVLVVDDEPDIRDVVKDGLEPQGFRILIASNGEDAMKMALIEHPDLILMDVLLGNQIGTDVCRKIKSTLPTFTPVILMTGQDDLREKFSGSTTDADDLLTKPFQIPELLMRVTSMLRMKTLQRRLDLWEKR